MSALTAAAQCVASCINLLSTRLFLANLVGLHDQLCLNDSSLIAMTRISIRVKRIQ